MASFLLVAVIAVIGYANGALDRFHYDETDFKTKTYGPTDWGMVKCPNVAKCPGWPTNWEKLKPSLPYKGMENMCLNCSKSDTFTCRRHTQSPIPLWKNVTAERRCIDIHRMNYVQGNCKFGEMKFQILPHVLRAYQPESCEVETWIDFSRGYNDPWMLKFTDISVPSQHTMDGKRYDAEVILNHVYSIDLESRLVGNVAILLEKGDESDHYDFLELYLRRWKTVEKKVKRDCARRNLQSYSNSTNRRSRWITTDKSNFYQPEETKKQPVPSHFLTKNHVSRTKKQPVPSQFLDKKHFSREWHPYDWLQKADTEYYFRYEGSLLEPPCVQLVHWRVLREPVKVSPLQMDRLERLIAERMDPDTCRNETAGKLRPESLKVDVNRPLQTKTREHKLVFCECVDWVSRSEKDIEWCKLSMKKRGVRLLNKTKT